MGETLTHAYEHFGNGKVSDAHLIFFWIVFSIDPTHCFINETPDVRANLRKCSSILSPFRFVALLEIIN